MSRTESLGILNGAQQDELAEIYGNVIDYITKNALSVKYKNLKYSGDAKAGSVEINRFSNSEVKDYGTARTSGNGDNVNNNGKVTINVDTDKEIVEELEMKDIKLHSVTELMNNRSTDHAKQAINTLDKAFFAIAESEGTGLTLTSTTLVEKVEELIQSVETTTNDFVDGVDRSDIVVFLKPAVYGQMRDHIDTIYSTDATSGKEEIGMYHGVRVESNHRQTADAIAMRVDSIGQPTVFAEYANEKVPFSNAVAIELFFSYGTKAVTPDLINVVASL